MSRLRVRRSASTLARIVQPSATDTERAQVWVSFAESTAPPSEAAGRYSATPSRSRRPRTTQQIGSSTKIQSRAPTRAPDLRVDRASDRSTQSARQRGDEERATDPIRGFGRFEGHVDSFQPDRRGHDDHDEHCRHERRACRGAREQLDRHEARAARRREQRPCDGPVTELVRHESDPEEQCEHGSGECRVQYEPELELRVEPLGSGCAADVSRGHEPGEGECDETRSPRSSAASAA